MEEDATSFNEDMGIVSHVCETTPTTVQAGEPRPSLVTCAIYNY